MHKSIYSKSVPKNATPKLVANPDTIARNNLERLRVAKIPFSILSDITWHIRIDSVIDAWLTKASWRNTRTGNKGKGIDTLIAEYKRINTAANIAR